MSDLPGWVSALYRATADLETACDQIGVMRNKIVAQTGALHLALPALRRSLYEYLQSCVIRNDVATVTPDEWADTARELAAIRAAAAIVGPQPDLFGVDTAWLDEAIRRAPE